MHNLIKNPRADIHTAPPWLKQTLLRYILPWRAELDWLLQLYCHSPLHRSAPRVWEREQLLPWTSAGHEDMFFLNTEKVYSSRTNHTCYFCSHWTSAVWQHAVFFILDWTSVFSSKQFWALEGGCVILKAKYFSQNMSLLSCNWQNGNRFGNKKHNRMHFWSGGVCQT